MPGDRRDSLGPQEEHRAIFSKQGGVDGAVRPVGTSFEFPVVDVGNT